MHINRPKYLKAATTLLAAVTLTGAPAESQAQEILVSAAASLRDAMTQAAAAYKQEKPGVTVRFNFGASGALQRQVEAGAPADVFISAASKQVDALIQKRLADAATRRVLARNRLVLIVPQSSARTLSFRQLGEPGVRRVAIGNPASVPAGAYAREVLEKIGVWRAVSPKAVRTRDVREVLAQVELGNVDAGIVYASDARSSRRVRVTSVAPAALHSPITYPMVVVWRARRTVAQADAARAFVRFLSGQRTRAILKRQGFLVG